MALCGGFSIDYQIASQAGDRPLNEDCAFAAAIGGARLFLLADGLGGHGKGELASKHVVACFARIFEEAADVRAGDKAEVKAEVKADVKADAGADIDADAPAESLMSGGAAAGRADIAPGHDARIEVTDLNIGGLLARAFDESQESLLAEQARLGCVNGMKATLVALCVFGNRACWGHIGDSRIYRFSGGKIAERTFDHSVPQMLAAAGDIREKDIRFHEDRPRLLRAMGSEWDTQKYEISGVAAIKAGDGFLLCSDGFWELIEDNDMSRQRKKSKSAREWIGRMENIVTKRGAGRSMDNYSAIAVII
jgi:serine/threonine protein phosphatase PrpC